MRRSLQDIDDQLQDHRINRDVARAMKADRAELIGDVQKLLDEANVKFQEAAALHFTSKCSYYSGQVAVLKKVIDLI